MYVFNNTVSDSLWQMIWIDSFKHTNCASAVECNYRKVPLNPVPVCTANCDQVDWSVIGIIRLIIINS